MSVLAFGALIPIAAQALAMDPNIMLRLEPSMADVNGDGELEALTLFMTQVQDIPDPASTGLIDPDPLSFVFGIHSFDLTTGGQLSTFTGQRVDDYFGFDVVNAGDVDGDGVDDLFVGSPLAGGGDPDSEPGKVELFSGATQTPLWSFDGQPGEKLGVELAYVGDVNGDGVADLAAASILSSANGQNSGRVYILSGVNGQPIHTIDGFDEFGAFGFSLAGLGDVDFDGVPDLAVGQPFDPEVDPNAMGSIHLVSGATGQILSSSQSPSIGAGDSYGNSIAVLGDLSGDGINDLLVTAPGRGNGRAYIVSGVDLSLIRELAGSLDPGEQFAFDGLVRDVDITGATPVASTIEIVSILTLPDGTLDARGWVYNAATGDLIFVEDSAGMAIAPFNTDVNVDGVVDVNDVALIPPRTVTFATSRADANRDGTIDADDLTYIISQYGILSPIGPSEVLRGCLGPVYDFDAFDLCECAGVPSLEDLMLNPGADCPDAPTGGGGGPPPPDWPGYTACLLRSHDAYVRKIKRALIWLGIRLDLCSLGSLFSVPVLGQTGGFALCAGVWIAKFTVDMQNAQDQQGSDNAKCKQDNHIP